MPTFTRKAIMAAFLKLLDERPLNKITIKDIVEECGINRNTFYYHFEDIPALIGALIQEEVESVMREHGSVASIEESLNIAVQFILKNRRATLHIHRSAHRDVYEQYLMKVCEYLVETYFATAFDKRLIAPEDWDIIVRSFRCWCFGLFIDWLDDGLREDIGPRISRLCELRQGMTEEMIARCRKA